MSQHSMRRALSVLATLGILCAPPPLMTGCLGGNSAEKAGSAVSGVTSMLAGDSVESKTAALAPYVEATNSYNDSAVTFAFSYDPSLQRMRSGEQVDNISVPSFDRLLEALEKARADKSTDGVFKDVDEAADGVIAVLKDLAPLAQKMDNYYSAKTYMTDGYKGGTEMIAQYLPLYDKFEAAYQKLDDAVSVHHKELRTAQLEQMRKDGKPNAANFIEATMKVRDLVDMLDHEPVDQAAAEAKIGEITNLVEQLPDTSETKSYKRDVNTFIGTFRSYLAGKEKSNEVIDDFNDTVNTSNRVDLNEIDGGKK